MTMILLKNFESVTKRRYNAAFFLFPGAKD